MRISSSFQLAEYINSGYLCSYTIPLKRLSSLDRKQRSGNLPVSRGVSMVSNVSESLQLLKYEFPDSKKEMIVTVHEKAILDDIFYGKRDTHLYEAESLDSNILFSQKDVLKIDTPSVLASVSNSEHQIPPFLVGNESLGRFTKNILKKDVEFFIRQFGVEDELEGFMASYGNIHLLKNFNGKVLKGANHFYLIGGEDFFTKKQNFSFLLSNPQSGTVIVFCYSLEHFRFQAYTFLVNSSSNEITGFSDPDKQCLFEDLESFLKALSCDKQIDIQKGIDANAYLASYALAKVLDEHNRWPANCDLDVYLSKVPKYNGKNFLDYVRFFLAKEDKSPLLLDIPSGRVQMIKDIIKMGKKFKFLKDEDVNRLWAVDISLDLSAVPPGVSFSKEDVFTSSKVPQASVVVCHDLLCLYPDSTRLFKSIWDRTKVGGYGFVHNYGYPNLPTYLFGEERFHMVSYYNYLHSLSLRGKGCFVEAYDSGWSFYKDREHLPVYGLDDNDILGIPALITPGHILYIPLLHRRNR
ncbi:hypothetical protein A2526_04765 [candidate division WOR-1 bacterium RIFOXYD2_FULL_36_8]|uniref:Uncharacterized protein n=1 Tax=candidate division WOR-1 bacterium RIFOXYB2_FULL_36_35 TaxID=1802578 RepID=A0A1F4S6C2_UNCSA|nr:MAG: hypothetical protein A2230_01370 [candidate division WOR-1 bacterium RIFOXYA2_FULL_36_21]OGC14375.1 MAG: hypothetical protein A2282_07985 [candidate division WOR-1 bacterium RIFOXYA12_FULL_36_13]OGC15949.1 MAG: hypothetical protein A2290_06840 [candidate division WOR-1 bacterium RIFOXYB2_FULL_36_35]OGC37275.1 MAG: hypothetical protein A2526_04765 [candidate division WOR-1 bacterium RIFOXYD2_FULL_36_8]